MLVNVRMREKISGLIRKNKLLKEVVWLALDINLFFESLLSDEKYANYMYKKYTGNTLDIQNPKTYNEKLWWLKFHYRDPLQKICSDKYRVREYVSKCGLEHILVKLYGVYEKVEDIKWDDFKTEVFLKCNKGSGGNCIYNPDKPFDKRVFERNFRHYLGHDYYKNSREWNYKDIKSYIIAEQVLRDEQGELPSDFKFMCFNGEPKLLLYSRGICDDNGRHSVTGGRFTNVYNMEREFLPINMDQPGRPDIPLEEIQNFDLMKEYAARLAAPFPQCRVDFYNIDGKIYFGEITFYHGGGCRNIQPSEWILKMGEWIDLEAIDKKYLI